MRNSSEINWDSPYSLSFVVVVVLTMIIVSAVTVFGNLLVILSFYLDKNIRTPSNYFILSLAISDFMIGLEGFPFYSIYTLRGDKWPLGWFVCDLWLSIDYSICLASIYTVLLITIDRFCSVRLPARYRNWRSKRKVNIMIILTWLVPALLFFVSIFGWSSFVGGRTIAEHECYVQFMNNPYFNMSMYIAYYWSTLVVMVILYAGIYRAAWALQKKSEEKQQHRLTVLSTMKGSSGNKQDGRTSRNPRDGKNGTAVMLSMAARSGATMQKTENLTIEVTSQIQNYSDEFTSSDFSAITSSASLDKSERIPRSGHSVMQNESVEVKSSGNFGYQIRRMSQAVTIDNVRTLLRKIPTQSRISISLASAGNAVNPVGLSETYLSGDHNGTETPKIHACSPVWKPRSIHSHFQLNGPLDDDTYTEPVAVFELPSENKSSRSIIESSTAPYVTPERSEITSSTPSDNTLPSHLLPCPERPVNNKPSHSTLNSSLDTETNTTAQSSLNDEVTMKSYVFLQGQGNTVGQHFDPMELTSLFANEIVNKIRYIDDSLSSSLRSDRRDSPVVSPVHMTTIPTIHEEQSLPRIAHSSESKADISNRDLPENKDMCTPLTIPVFHVDKVVRRSFSADNEIFTSDQKNKNSSTLPNRELDLQKASNPPKRRSTKRSTKKCRLDNHVQSEKQKLLTTPTPTQMSTVAFESDRQETGESQSKSKKRRRASHMLALLRYQSRKDRSGNFRSENRARKALRTITFILGAFVVFWTPFYVCATIIGFCYQCVPPWLFTSSYYLCYLNSAINPFCYAFANVQFKKTFIRILKGNFRRIN